MNNKRTEKQKNYGRFRSEFAIALVLITMGGPLGVVLGVGLFLYLVFKKPKDMATMGPTLFLMFLWFILLLLIFIIGIL